MGESVQPRWRAHRPTRASALCPSNGAGLTPNNASGDAVFIRTVNEILFESIQLKLELNSSIVVDRVMLEVPLQGGPPKSLEPDRRLVPGSLAESNRI